MPLVPRPARKPCDCASLRALAAKLLEHAATARPCSLTDDEHAALVRLAARPDLDSSPGRIIVLFRDGRREEMPADDLASVPADTIEKLELA